MTEPVPVRDASTVVLLRDGADGIEAWLLTRVTNMVFAAGMSVFPGGRVEAADAALPMLAEGTAAMCARFGCDEEKMRALLGAAVRETFEETGVLLSTPPADLPDSRAAVEGGSLAFGDLLRTNGLVLDTGALRPWSRWITPEGEVRRYDTRFFVGALPDGAVAHDVTSESSSADWVPVALAVQQAQRGERQLLPPTMLTLVSIGEHATVGDVLAAADARTLDPVRPTLIVGEDERVSVELPDGRVMVINP